MNEDNSILWKRDTCTPGGSRYVGLCPRCKSPTWPIAAAEGGVIRLALGYEPHEDGPETAWVWCKPRWGNTQGRATKRELETHPESLRGASEGSWGTALDRAFILPVEPKALVFCRNPAYRGRPCRWPVRIATPFIDTSLHVC